MIDQSEL